MISIFYTKSYLKRIISTLFVRNTYPHLNKLVDKTQCQISIISVIFVKGGYCLNYRFI